MTGISDRRRKTIRQDMEVGVIAGQGQRERTHGNARGNLYDENVSCVDSIKKTITITTLIYNKCNSKNINHN